MIGPEDEAARAGEPGAAGFGDAVTFAFGDPAQGLYGSARLGLAAGEPVRASGLGLLFRAGELVAVNATGGIELGAADWSVLEAGVVRATIEQPLQAWRVAYDSDDGGFELGFEALSAPAELGADAVAAQAAGLREYEQLCRVTGSVRCGDERLRIDCLGQRGHQWGAPDWERIELARTISAWFEEAPAVVLSSVRPDGAAGHAAEATTACLLGADEVTAIADPLLSTTLDGDGRQRRASLELWEQRDEGAFPHRAAGEAVCGTTLDLGRLRLDCAFFHWRMDGREGVGRYDVLRRA
ncbi:MAG TPA: hypothetical protein VFF79_20495 [Conexibacter sp.]|jgi:hypothetical protein|nr:hypothetical protein [Conexibacter sp.]